MNKEDMEFSARFIPEIQLILGRTLLTFEVDETEDLEYGTDLLGTFRHTSNKLRIACRVRRAKYLRYDDFTVRYDRPSGIKCEYEKIMDGYGDFMVYGFGDELKLLFWSVLNLEVFRKQIEQGYVSITDKRIKLNHDRSSRFAIFRYDEFPPSFVLRNSIHDA